jgi:Ca-activated chloride channel family protein
VLLVTDGETSALSGESGNAAVAAARELANAKIPLYVLALGSAQGATIPLPEGGVVEENGAPVISRLDAASFGALAASTGGQFAQISGDDGDLAQLYERGMLTLRAATPRKDSTRAWRELYPWLLVPALLLWLLLHVSRRSAAAAALALAATGANAAEPDAYRDAYQSYRKQDYLLAQQFYARQDGWNARMGEGASAYRRKDYGYAVKQFTEALLLARTPTERADALFNLGNSHYLAGNKTAALDALQGVLRYREDARARANLARVTAQMKAAPAPAGEGVSGRRGRGLGQGENLGGDAPMGMEAEKEQPQVLQEQDGQDSDEARGGGGRRQSGGDAQADVRAAQKKLELVRDQPDQLNKRLITQDRSPEATGAQRPW